MTRLVTSGASYIGSQQIGSMPRECQSRRFWNPPAQADSCAEHCSSRRFFKGREIRDVTLAFRVHAVHGESCHAAAAPAR